MAPKNMTEIKISALFLVVVVQTLEACPKVYRCSEGEKVILMEDLKVSGFHLNDAHDQGRKLALNREEMSLTLRELARVHAVSHHVLQTYPGGMETFARDFPHVEQGTVLI